LKLGISLRELLNFDLNFKYVLEKDLVLWMFVVKVKKELELQIFKEFSLRGDLLTTS